MADLFQGIEYNRPPTRAEIKRGYGARHYKSFPMGMCISTRYDRMYHDTPINFRLKKRLKCPVDGLFYSRF